jgi:uncharacterized membrane protein
MSQIEKRVSVTVFTPNRLEALTDAVFAIVMTLLVLEISIPEIAHPSLQAELPRRLFELWPKLYSYVISFLVLGILWSLHHRSFHSIKRSDNVLVWLNIVFLMFVALIPFSTSLLGNYGTEQLSIVIYTTNVLLALVMRLIIWTYATGKYRLVDSDINPHWVKRDKLISIGIFLVFMLVIGISFINVTAAFSILVLLLVAAIVMLLIARRLYK